ncbi:hypothetical protein Lspi_2500 [Legionella spiritensis]|uniref:Uncharacterized protein n=1 Tax=Legionella spiritensis TaxID=452 RepID=A0A0W0YZ07_LEGSP|nr:hypothetical protein Lspi_2500 [Legionella spiritensis]SNV31339.1 Uncharacterised protein [Legionella spiritensis]
MNKPGTNINMMSFLKCLYLKLTIKMLWQKRWKLTGSKMFCDKTGKNIGGMSRFVFLISAPEVDEPETLRADRPVKILKGFSK